MFLIVNCEDHRLSSAVVSSRIALPGYSEAKFGGFDRKNACEKFGEVFACFHESGDGSASRICEACIAESNNSTQLAVEDIAAASRFAAAVMVLEMRQRFISLKQIAKDAAAVLNDAVFAREEYLEKFYEMKSSDAFKYTDEYGTGGAAILNEDWLE